MTISRRTAFGLALAAPFILVAGANAADTVRIGYQLPLTGSTAQYGQDFKTAADIALTRFNASGKLPVKVEIVFADHLNKPDVGAARSELQRADRHRPQQR